MEGRPCGGTEESESEGEAEGAGEERGEAGAVERSPFGFHVLCDLPLLHVDGPKIGQ